jgi:hypothetical protein
MRNVENVNVDRRNGYDWLAIGCAAAWLMLIAGYMA